ncbi:MAG: urtB [Rhodospirillales bacterium]|nr:urtB [Rhodospirillales bacterium]
MVRATRTGRPGYGFFVALLALLIFGATIGPHSASAADLPELVKTLGSDDFSEKDGAIKALGELGDPRAIVVLQALAAGQLAVVQESQKVAITEATGDDLKLTDAVTGEDLGTVAEDAIDRIRVNNRLRSSIDGAMSALQIFSKSPEQRFAASRDAFRTATPAMAATLEKALTTETVPAVRDAMARSLAAVRLKTGTSAERTQAIATLASTTDPEIAGMLRGLADAGDTPPDVKRAAETAAQAIERKLKMISVAGNLIEGISLGSVLLLAAIGLAITFGLMGVINMAHGEMIMLGAYTAYVVQELFRAFLPPGIFGLYLIVAIPVAFLVAGAVGVALERCIIRFLYGRPLETLLATWGISLMLQQLVRSVFGAPNKAVANPEWMTGGFNVIGGLTVTWNRVYIIIFCFVVLAALAVTLSRTSYGLYVRAVMQNRPIASVMGIATARIDALTFGLGSGIAGMAGVALSQIGNVSPNLGTIYIVDSFLVVVFGGVGSLMGTLVGAMGIGIVNKLLEPFAGAILGKIVVLVAIILFIQKRPRGLFALKGRSVEA